MLLVQHYAAPAGLGPGCGIWTGALRWASGGERGRLLSTRCLDRSGSWCHLFAQASPVAVHAGWRL